MPLPLFAAAFKRVSRQPASPTRVVPATVEPFIALGARSVIGKTHGLGLYAGVVAGLALAGCNVVYDIAQQENRQRCESIVTMAERNACLRRHEQSYDAYDKQRKTLVEPAAPASGPDLCIRRAGQAPLCPN